jgi:hypothetical protein
MPRQRTRVFVVTPPAVSADVISRKPLPSSLARPDDEDSAISCPPPASTAAMPEPATPPKRIDRRSRLEIDPLPVPMGLLSTFEEHAQLPSKDPAAALLNPNRNSALVRNATAWQRGRSGTIRKCRRALLSVCFSHHSRRHPPPSRLSRGDMLRGWRDTWSGAGHILAAMTAAGYHVELRQWRHASGNDDGSGYMVRCPAAEGPPTRCTLAMVQRYAHMASGHLQAAVERIASGTADAVELRRNLNAAEVSGLAVTAETR